MALSDRPDDLELLLRRIIREEAGITPVAPAPKWRGGTLVLRPGTPGLQEKTWPIETFFHKVVMLRNRLRTLEQQVNASDLPDDVKLKLQGYVSGCYGSLTSFNLLFANEEDQFKGQVVTRWTPRAALGLYVSYGAMERRALAPGPRTPASSPRRSASKVVCSLHREREIHQHAAPFELKHEGRARLGAVNDAARSAGRSDNPLTIDGVNHVAGLEASVVGIERGGARRCHDDT